MARNAPAASRRTKQDSHGNGSNSEPVVTQQMCTGLALLLQAADYARDAGLDVWNFAVEFDEVRNAGLLTSELRWLVAKGYVEQAREIDGDAFDQRSFEIHHRFRFTADSCFVLTDAGIDFVQTNLPQPLRVAIADDLSQSQAGPPQTVLIPENTPQSAASEGNHQDHSPRWDSQRRELWAGTVLVKRYRVPAKHQETILCVFEEERWPPRIDDPLSPQHDIDSKRQLHTTICSLNRHQKWPAIHFRGDGSGNGILWEFTASGEGSLKSCRSDGQ